MKSYPYLDHVNLTEHNDFNANGCRYRSKYGGCLCRKGPWPTLQKCPVLDGHSCPYEVNKDRVPIC